MARERNSTVIAARIPHTLHVVLKAVTEENGSTISAYVGTYSNATMSWQVEWMIRGLRKRNCEQRNSEETRSKYEKPKQVRVAYRCRSRLSHLYGCGPNRRLSFC